MFRYAVVNLRKKLCVTTFARNPDTAQGPRYFYDCFRQREEGFRACRNKALRSKKLTPRVLSRHRYGATGHRCGHLRRNRPRVRHLGRHAGEVLGDGVSVRLRAAFAPPFSCDLKRVRRRGLD